MSRQLLLAFKFANLLMFSLISWACSKHSSGGGSARLCGGASGSDRLNGLTWLSGSPTQANVVCHIQNQSADVLLSLDPESRDPILFRDFQLNRHILVERFSGVTARPSRVTWFSEFGQFLGQRGQWPQNVYGLTVISSDEAIVSGFDAGVLLNVHWSNESFAEAKSDPVRLSFDPTQVHPVHTLSNGSWLAAIDNGYDLTKYVATDAKAIVFERSQANSIKVSKVISDSESPSGRTCQNAFQTLPLSRSEVILSCNPQYFGAVLGAHVNLYKVSLQSDGSLQVKELLRRDGADVQRIDLWGVDSERSRAFVAFKKTTATDYEGQLESAGWVNLTTLELSLEKRFSGPIHALAGGTVFVSACRYDAEGCRSGQFVLIDGSAPWQSQSKIETLTLAPELPFLSFAQDLR